MRNIILAILARMPTNKSYSTAITLTVIGLLIGPLSYADTVWIDVRTSIEYQIDHIDGDTRISYGDIVAGMSELYPDKSTEIRLYCRSGGRADKAMASLREAGYTNVSNAGGIDDARKEIELGEYAPPENSSTPEQFHY